MKTRLAILGVGRWGTHLVRNFLAHPDAEIVAIADSLPANLTAIKTKFSLDEQSILLTTDWQTIKKQVNLDAIVVVTPASTHYPLIKEALQSGYHVLAEKPLTLDPVECLELTRLAQQQQRQLMIDHTYLFHSAVNQGQSIIKAGKLGELRYGYASRTHLGPVRQDVDALWDLAIHDIAIFNHWLGQYPEKVQAEGQVWLQKNLADVVWVTLFYPNGFQAKIHLCWCNPDKQRKLCIVGSQGTLIFDEMSTDETLTLQKGYLETQGEKFLPQGQAKEVIKIAKAEPLKEVCDHFLRSIETNNTCEFSSGFVATKLVQILTCLSISMERQGEVIDIPPQAF
ncbi:Gfo/Idh/MocA family oxidoreductase [Crocosphaera sp. XPORK-15E]|uniref:Gfo/Idh/MocA family protein n=1 Tax=Crocosphaera sp. XPORK-15E TaxID=3110247 RepID=UPI002B21C466|nr:Gfo/Idh/MocA family oxidoreductase [Crocosphaera sp. XPORK-15E]MEA5534604.1 Gfo/Idh/MocA family oxidoreductase [Crocosphaera sp. XPORK-15E]